MRYEYGILMLLWVTLKHAMTILTVLKELDADTIVNVWVSSCLNTTEMPDYGPRAISSYKNPK